MNIARWPIHTLDELAADEPNALCIGPFGSELLARDLVGFGVPVVFVRNVRPNRFDASETRYVTEAKARKLQAHRVRPGDIVITKMGLPPCLAAEYPVDAQDGIVTADIIKLTPNKKRVNNRFLVHFLNSPFTRVQVEKFTFGVTRPKVTLKDFRSIRIYLPSLPEQRRIADVLDKADAIRCKRKEAIFLTEKLLRSAFLEMFGDPVTNPKGWEKKLFGDLVRETQLGLVRGSSEQGPHRAYPYIKMNSIRADGHLDLRNVTLVDASDTELESTRLKKGDFLFNTRNSRELVGKAAVFHADGEYLFNNNIMRVRFSDNVEPDFVAAYWQTSGAQRELEKRKSGTTSVFAIYYKSLATLPVPIPPHEKQKKYTDLCKAVRTGLRLHEQMTEKCNALFDSLVHRAFNGGLTGAT